MANGNKVHCLAKPVLILKIDNKVDSFNTSSDTGLPTCAHLATGGVSILCIRCV